MGHVQNFAAVTAGLVLGGMCGGCSSGQPSQGAHTMEFAGYPSEAPLFRIEGGIVFSSGRTASGEGDLTGPIARDARFDRVLRTAEGDMAFGLDHIAEDYLAGHRGRVAVLRINDASDRAVIEPIASGRFTRVWDASAEPVLQVLAESETGGDLVLFLQDGDRWKTLPIPTQGQLKLAYLAGDGGVAITGGPSGCAGQAFDVAGRRSSLAGEVSPALCTAHAVWVLRDPVEETLYIYAAEHQGSHLFVSDGHGELIHLAENIDAAPAGLQPTRLLMFGGVLYFDAGADAAGTPLVGTYTVATRERRVRPLPRPVTDPVRPTLMGFLTPLRAAEPVEVVFRGEVWSTQPIT